MSWAWHNPYFWSSLHHYPFPKEDAIDYYGSNILCLIALRDRLSKIDGWPHSGSVWSTHHHHRHHEGSIRFKTRSSTWASVENLWRPIDRGRCIRLNSPLLMSRHRNYFPTEREKRLNFQKSNRPPKPCCCIINRRLKIHYSCKYQLRRIIYSAPFMFPWCKNRDPFVKSK